ncbi:protein kinase, putative, partial [Bodo saltans]
PLWSTPTSSKCWASWYTKDTGVSSWSGCRLGPCSQCCRRPSAAFVRLLFEGMCKRRCKALRTCTPVASCIVKPGNMLLGSDGSVKLTDFGTSRTLGHSEETVQTGTVVGTVPYLAPECVRGTYSAASDVWAMGCTALHMITGRTPWMDEVRDNVALIFRLGNIAVASQLILPQALENAEMSAEFRAFITSALTLDRHERPTARDLLHDFFH